MRRASIPPFPTKSLSLLIPEGPLLPSRVFESMPALEDFTLHITQETEGDSLFSITPLISALQGGMAFQRLTKFSILGECRIGDVMGGVLLDALAAAACAPLLKILHLYSCDIGTDTAATLGALLGQDTFSALDFLDLNSNPRIGRDGVLALLAGVKDATQMSLTRNLGLSNVGINDDGMVELFDLIQAGKLRRLSHVNVSENVNVTDEGIFTLAHSLQSAAELAKGGDHQAQGCLSPALESLIVGRLTCLKPRSLGALALAAFMSFPQLRGLHVQACDDDIEYETIRQMVDGMSSLRTSLYIDQLKRLWRGNVSVNDEKDNNRKYLAEESAMRLNLISLLLASHRENRCEMWKEINRSRKTSTIIALH